MKTKPNLSTERMTQIRERHKQLRPLLEAEREFVQQHWDELLEGVPDIVQRHRAEFDAYIAKHGPMTRGDVIERALQRLFSEV